LSQVLRLRGYLATKDTKMNERIIGSGLILVFCLIVITGARNGTSRSWSEEKTARIGTQAPSRTIASAMPDTWYESCPWIWTAPGTGYNISISSVHEIAEDGHSRCTDFGRWVVKKHPDMKPEWNPDSPKFAGQPHGDGQPVDGKEFPTKDEAESARQAYIEKRSANQKIEELDWNP
jgi:hypothetical protein